MKERKPPRDRQLLCFINNLGVCLSLLLLCSHVFMLAYLGHFSAVLFVFVVRSWCVVLMTCNYRPWTRLKKSSRCSGKSWMTCVAVSAWATASRCILCSRGLFSRQCLLVTWCTSSGKRQQEIAKSWMRCSRRKGGGGRHTRSNEWGRQWVCYLWDCFCVRCAYVFTNTPLLYTPDSRETTDPGTST